MDDVRITISEEEKIERNRQLRKKKVGMMAAFVVLAVMMSAVIYMLQYGEQASESTLWKVVGFLTLVLFASALMLLRFTRKLTLDMQSDEKIVEIGRIARAPDRYSNASAMSQITLDIQGRLLVLSRQQFKRALTEAYDMNRIYLYDQFQLEFTPYGRHLTRIIRL
jgi:uncharacterized membrane protein YecN with MAPEG domain